jgi:hypothetical protein
MGARILDRVILNEIIKSGAEHVTFVGHGYRDKLINQCIRIGLDLTLYDFDPKFGNPIDAVFDNVEFSELVVVFNAEKHYPIGRITSREMIVVGDHDEHNGDCNPVFSCRQLINQNNLTNITYQDHIDKWYVVKGVSCAN